MDSLQFSKLADLYRELEKVSSGNKMREILSGFFKKVTKQEIDKVAYLTLGKIDADFKHIELGLAEKMILRAIADAAEKDLENIKKVFRKTGDIGLTAEQTVKTKGKRLAVAEVFSDLHKIATESGSGSQERKISILTNLLVHATPKEAKYIARIAQGTLRLGVAAMTVLDSLSITFTGSKSNKPKLEHAYNICSDVGLVAKTIAIEGLKGIARIPVNVGVPIRMMLAQRVKSLKELEKKMPGLKAAEEKYDGERIQAHKTKKGKILLFSRRLDDISAQFPDLIKALQGSIKARTFVIEGEAVPVDKKGNPLPFQVLMQRRRKYEVEEYIKKVPVRLYLFDLLYLNGKTFIHEDYLKRHTALEKAVKKTDIVQMAGYKKTDKIEGIEDFFNQSIDKGYEGVIIKSCAKKSVYQAGTRGWLWIKWKKDYLKEIKDTFDLVVVGAFAGRGRRAGTYGALLCAVYHKKKDQFETFTKLGTGFTDKMLAELPKILKKYKTSSKPARVILKKEMKPDYLFEPGIVVEVLGAEITKSPIHSSGLALRFPRFIRFRDDKSAEQATTTKEITQMASRKK
jgi:DNA ligase-1